VYLKITIIRVGINALLKDKRGISARSVIQFVNYFIIIEDPRYALWRRGYFLFSCTERTETGTLVRPWYPSRTYSIPAAAIGRGCGDV